MISAVAGMLITWFLGLVSVSRRTFQYLLASCGAREPVEAPWLAPVVVWIEPVVERLAGEESGASDFSGD